MSRLTWSAFVALLTLGASSLVACSSDNATNVDDVGPSANLADSGTPSSEAGTAEDEGEGGAGEGDAGADSAAKGPVVTIGAASRMRGSNNPVLIRGSYDYAPTVMHDGNYRMWWCGGVAGDHVLYAEASSLDGPWHARGSSAANSVNDVFGPTGAVGDFDGAHTCDPSVIRVNGTYYMYYGGLGKDGTPNNTTRIGLATSADGMTWSRTHGGKPILSPAQSLAGKPNQYGAGQPSAFYKDGFFYLSFTDTSAAGTNPGNGAGQFVLRSKDPTFQSGVEELSKTGFIPQPASSKRAYSMTEAFSPDWTYVPAIDMYLMAVHSSQGKEGLRFFDASFTQVKQVDINFNWSEGPGIVKRPDGQLDPVAACDRIGVDLMHAVGPDTNSWNLAHSGADVATGTTCATVPWPKVLEGSLIVSSGKPLTMVRGGERLQFALSAPASRLARTSVAVTDAIFSAVPFGASMHAKDPVVGATGRPAAFELDNNRLWPSSCLELITDNQSSITTISAADFDALKQASVLYCVK